MYVHDASRDKPINSTPLAVDAMCLPMRTGPVKSQQVQLRAAVQACQRQQRHCAVQEAPTVIMACLVTCANAARVPYQIERPRTELR